MKPEIQDGSGRTINLLEISSWSLPQNLQNSWSHFICFIVGDASETPDEKICSFIEQLLQKGMVYLCAWGPDCVRVHDIADFVIVKNELESDNEATIMTTWHNKESLDSALWFALYCTWPHEAFETTCNASIIIVINNDGWTNNITQKLSNLEQFNAELT